MANILIIYSTTDGHTLKICQQLQRVIEEQAHQVKLASVDDQTDAELKLFDKIVIGASIRYGKHRSQVYDFIKRNEELINAKPNAFFSVNVVARKSDKNSPETNPYIKQFQRKTSWRAKELAVFAGKIDYQKYNFWNRQIIRLIMLITKGPTDQNAVMEFTDWKKVEAFGQRVCVM
jgi:menaquinone-dependent protoporphyrinogen oxidase